MDESSIPLRIESGAPKMDRLGDLFIVPHIFGDAKPPRLAAVHFRVDPLHQTPAIVQICAEIDLVAVDVVCTYLVASQRSPSPRSSSSYISALSRMYWRTCSLR
jgi:hypothetical protein